MNEPFSSSRRKRRVAFLGVALLLAVAGARGVADEETPSPWRDTALIEKRLEEAIVAVEKECGAAFRTRPTVALSRSEDLLPILRKEISAQLAASGENVDVDGALRAAAAMLIAKYEPATRVIHLVPKTVDALADLLKMPELASEGVLRVILAHETTHALDFERFPLEETRQRLGTSEAMFAFGGVVEGHAQLISERVAASWGIGKDWQTYTRAITTTPAGLDPAVRMLTEAMAAQVGFGYLKGHAFLKAVEAARGREGVEAALRSPPATTREVEKPDLWLQPATKGDALDAKAIFAALREAVERATTPPAPEKEEHADDAGKDDAAPAEPPKPEEGGKPKKGGKPDKSRWTVQVTPAIASVLETQFRDLPEAEHKGVFDTMEEGQILVMAKETRMVIGFVARFATPEAAKRFVDVDVRASRKKDETLKAGPARIASAAYEDGIGKDHARPGTRVRKQIVVGHLEQEVRAVIGHVGRHAIDVTAVSLGELDDAALGAAIEEACRAIEALPSR